MNENGLDREERVFQMMEKIALSLEKVVESQLAVIAANKEMANRRVGTVCRRVASTDRRRGSGERRKANRLNALPGVQELALSGDVESTHSDKEISFEAPSVLTAAQVARMLNTSKGTVYLWVNQNKIPYIKIGGSIRFPEDEIHRWIANGTVLEKPSSIRKYARRSTEETEA